MDDVIAAGLETANCNLCGGEGVSDPRAGVLLGLQGGYGVRYCVACDLRWLSPRPTQAGYELVYDDAHYFATEGETNFAMISARRRIGFSDRLHRILTLFERPISLLDYGAATGEFVQLARQAGIAADGVEFSRDARAQAAARGLHLLSPEDARNTSKRFDVIHMNHVLEHMPDPLAHLRWCREHLVDDGLLVVEVPFQFDSDIDRVRQLVRGVQPAKFDAYSLHHTFFFSPRSLRTLCTMAGFSPTKSRSMVNSQPNMTGKRKLLQVLMAVLALRGHGGDLLEVYARPSREKT